MAVQNRNPNALTGNQGALCRNDLSPFDMPKNPQRLLFTLFFFSGNKRDDVSDHFRPLLKVLTGTGNCLIGGYRCFIRFQVFPRSQNRGITLNGTIRFYCNKAPFGVKPLPLKGDDLRMFRIDLGNDHRDIRRPPVRTVIGNDRRLRLCISLFDRPDLIL